ncbi:hypothetical protein BJ742DRAFT_134312 [Cladochytrium replicatum]|nr:hypothetical protein BJ742DRAFT_134312 [Cladochytrium replicatum]
MNLFFAAIPCLLRQRPLSALLVLLRCNRCNCHRSRCFHAQSTTLTRHTFYLPHKLNLAPNRKSSIDANYKKGGQ